MGQSLKICGEKEKKITEQKINQNNPYEKLVEFLTVVHKIFFAFSP